MAQEGATVIVADINGEGAAETVRLIEADGNGKGIAYHLDAGNTAAIKALMDFTDKEFGRLNVLFNHIGTPGPAGLPITDERMTRFWITLDSAVGNEATEKKRAVVTSSCTCLMTANLLLVIELSCNPRTYSSATSAL